MANRFIEIASPTLSCALCDRGAAIASVRVRGGDGRFTEVALAPRSLLTDEADPSLAGRTIGPCCGRVQDGAAVIDGRDVRLTQNEGRNHLHGGMNGCAHRRWEVSEASSSCVEFRAKLPDGLDGYPGNRMLAARYTVASQTLRVAYTATTDATTWIDMTNHVYWDLGGRFDGSAMDQRLQIAADGVVFNDESHLPRAVAAAEGAFDFSAPCALSEKAARHGDHPQLRIARGFNNAFAIDPDRRRALGFAARLTCPKSGIALAMDTDRPAIVLYSSGFLDASTALRTPPGVASPGCAIALEAQGFPDPFHLPGVRAECLAPGQTWRHWIEWRFEASDV